MADKSGAAEKKQAPAAAAPKTEHAPKSSPSKKGGHEPLPGGCFGWGCKAQAHRFNFCDEHYDQFKFGLIKKTGELVSDHEKKFEHYTTWKAKRGARQVA